MITMLITIIGSVAIGVAITAGIAVVGFVVLVVSVWTIEQMVWLSKKLGIKSVLWDD